MRRHIDATLETWASRQQRKPLVLLGARQVGKTYAIRCLGERAFDSVAYLDFSRDAALASLFEDSIDPGVLVPRLEAVLHMSIEPGRTLLVFDEVQLCERALTSLKYFCEEAPEQHVVAAGSLLGVKVNRDCYSFLVGKVELETLHPLDFEEFLWACGEERLAVLIEEALPATPERVAAFPLHDRALELMRTYLLMGGMPEVVNRCAPGRGGFEAPALEMARSLQHDIDVAYVADMTKYSSSSEAPRIFEAWRSIPSQLAKENHKFQYAKVRSGGRANQYELPIAWLESAGMVTRCTQVTDGVAPLRQFENPSAFKLYMADTGLLSAAYDALPSDVLPSEGKAAGFRGALAENYALQQIVAHASVPHYWGVASKSEVEFVARNKTGDVLPIEVKSGSNVRANSLMAYREKYRPPYVVRMSGKNFGFENGILSVPLYAACFFVRELL